MHRDHNGTSITELTNGIQLRSTNPSAIAILERVEEDDERPRNRVQWKGEVAQGPKKHDKSTRPMHAPRTEPPTPLTLPDLPREQNAINIRKEETTVNNAPAANFFCPTCPGDQPKIRKTKDFVCGDCYSQFVKEAATRFRTDGSIVTIFEWTTAKAQAKLVLLTEKYVAARAAIDDLEKEIIWKTSENLRQKQLQLDKLSHEVRREVFMQEKDELWKKRLEERRTKQKAVTDAEAKLTLQQKNMPQEPAPPATTEVTAAETPAPEETRTAVSAEVQEEPGNNGATPEDIATPKPRTRRTKKAAAAS